MAELRLRVTVRFSRIGFWERRLSENFEKRYNDAGMFSLTVQKGRFIIYIFV